MFYGDCLSWLVFIGITAMRWHGGRAAIPGHRSVNDVRRAVVALPWRLAANLVAAASRGGLAGGW
ncbi:hypothetical protein [Vogesella indigofera]|uniref:hypothetical protein n=1 Tax=Vogesella indigofera TaxID=45465 RepID=UPI00234E6480|nr:hypothetical protein [Vogesella indigofera]MDC7696302.1 hypothetical protein [Vogesella indigofera]